MKSLVNSIKEICSEEGFKEDILDFLVDICAVNTTPNSDVSVMKESEEKVFNLIRNKLEKLTFDDAKVEKFYVSPEIEKHRFFSQLHFTKTPDRPEGLSAEETYKHRYNLVYMLDNKVEETGRNMALNAHIDVVAPYFSPRREEDKVFARGAIDDKGNIAVMLGTLIILDKLQQKGIITLKNKLTNMFVIEEETGGNGSLSLSLDHKLKERYDSLFVLECSDNKIYPGNRGAVWFEANINLKKEFQTSKVRLLEAIIFSIIEMQNEGAKIKSESAHPLFPHRPVQTCNGMLGPFGEHPSRICGHLVFILEGKNISQKTDKINSLINSGLDKYIGIYGDKCKYIDKSTGKPKVDHHLDISFEKDKIRVEVHGSTGHMGSILENDAAITKWAYIAKELFIEKQSGNLDFELNLENFDSSKLLVLEGGQGFLPTHPMDQVQERMRNAFLKGIKQYLNIINVDSTAIDANVSYDKLHNEAFANDADAPSMKNAHKAGVETGYIDPNAKILGWDVSCDARLFAIEYPEMGVVTGGVGSLGLAHSDNEHLNIPDLFNTIAFTTLFTIIETKSDYIS